MRKLVVILDDELDPWLGKQTNQNQTVRDALRRYKGNIDTHTLQGFRQAFKQTYDITRETEKRLTELYEIVERMDRRLEELIS